MPPPPDAEEGIRFLSMFSGFNKLFDLRRHLVGGPESTRIKGSRQKH